MHICECVSVCVWESTQNREGKRETDLLEEISSCGCGSLQVCRAGWRPREGLADASAWSVKGIWSRIPSSEVPSGDLSVFNLSAFN